MKTLVENRNREEKLDTEVNEKNIRPMSFSMKNVENKVDFDNWVRKLQLPQNQLGSYERWFSCENER